MTDPTEFASTGKGVQSPRARRRWFFTVAEVRFQALVLAVCLWTPLLVNEATARRPVDRYLHTNDFLHFYTIGAVVRHGQTRDLYDWRRLRERTLALDPLPDRDVFLPVYGPQVALLFSPLSTLPYPVAAPVWAIVSVALCAAAVALTLRHCPKLRQNYGLVWLAFFASPALWQLVLFGQTSALLLLFFALASYGWMTGAQVPVGLGIGLLFYKPHFGLVPLVLLVARRQWRAIAVACGVVAGQITVSVALVGIEPWRQYVNALRGLSGIRVVALEPLLHHLHSLRTLWALLLPPTAAFTVYLLTAFAVLVMLVQVWRRCEAGNLRVGALLLATALVTPHVGVYDLVLLFPAWLLLADWMCERPGAPWLLLYLAVAAPILDDFSVLVPVRFPVLATLAMFLAIWGTALRSGRQQLPATLTAEDSTRVRPHARALCL